MYSSIKRIALRSTGVATVMLLLVGLLVAPLTSRADTMKQSQAPRSVMIPAGGSATIMVRGFCLDFGKPFPTEETRAKGIADPRIRQALNYAVNRGYTEGNPIQVEQAIWFLRDGQWRATDRTIGQEIVDNATDSNAPNDAGDGTSLADAVAAGRVSVTARFTPQTADAFYGDGEAQITNLTSGELRLFMPIGVVFVVGDGGGAFQDLIAYEIGTGSVQVQNTPQITAQATGTVQATTQPTLTAVTVVETPTQLATVAGETPTQAPIATLAPAPTETPTTPAPTENPGTGAGEDALMALILLAVALGFGSIMAGFALKRA